MPFSSLAVFNGKPIACGPDGLFELTGDTDDGTAIDALVDLPTTDLGLFEEKRIEAVRLGGQSTGSIKLTFTPDETDAKAQSVTMEAARSGEAEHTRASTLRRISGGHGTYYRTRIENVGGGDFSVDGIQLVAAVLKRKTW
jgi:hypothetical protein